MQMGNANEDYHSHYEQEQELRKKLVHESSFIYARDEFLCRTLRRDIEYHDRKQMEAIREQMKLENAP